MSETYKPRYYHEVMSVPYHGHDREIIRMEKQGWELVAVNSAPAAPMNTIQLYFRIPTKIEEEYGERG